MMGEKHRRNDWKPDSRNAVSWWKGRQDGSLGPGGDEKGLTIPSYELLSSPHAISIELPYD